MDYKKIGAFLAGLRKDKGLTQTQLAELLNVTHQAISRWEIGESIPDIQTLKNLADFYQITIDEILNGEKALTNIKTLSIDLEMNKLKKMNIISFTLILVGFILFYGITWVSYYEVIGFTVQLLLILTGVVLFLFRYHDLKQVLIKETNEEQKNTSFSYIKKIVVRGGIFIIWTIILTSPYILFDNSFYQKAIITKTFYFSILVYFILISIIISVIYYILVDFHYKKKYHMKCYPYHLLHNKIIMRLSQIFKKFIHLLKKTDEFIEKHKHHTFFKYLYLLILIIPTLFSRSIIELIIPLLDLGLLLLFIYDLYKILKHKNFIMIRISRMITSFFYLFLIGYLPTKDIDNQFLYRIFAVNELLILLTGLIIMFYIVKAIKDRKNRKIKLIELISFIVFYGIFWMGCVVNTFNVDDITESNYGIQGIGFTYSNPSLTLILIIFYIVFDLLIRSLLSLELKEKNIGNELV